jgi:lipopolysaccharide export system permease protein
VLIFRYLAKEVFITLAALTTILLLIFMSNQFVTYLNRAASGQIPAMLVMKLMMLELPTLMGLLLPLGFYVALLVAYGRLYAESEMIVLQACGYGPRQLLQHSFIMATAVAILVTVIMMWASPFVAIERATLLRTTGIQTLIQTIVPGHFRAVSNGQQVFYVASMTRDHTKAEHVFLARLVQKDGQRQWDVLWAQTAFAETEPGTYEDYVILKNGKEYQGVPGRADYQVAEFERYKARLPHPSLEIKGDIRTSSTSSLWPLNNPDLIKAAELQWRLSVPLMVLTLTLVGVPLSRVNPRAGKYAKLLPAIVLYIIYANFMFIARDWLISGKTPLWLGMWWIHLIVALLGLLLIWRNQVKLS